MLSKDLIFSPEDLGEQPEAGLPNQCLKVLIPSALGEAGQGIEPLTFCPKQPASFTPECFANIVNFLSAL